MTTGFSSRRALRPTTKMLPEYGRGHNRSLVLQTLFRDGRMSRADIARGTGLTRVTMSTLVAELIADNLVVEIGQREDSRPGKPATILDLNRDAFEIVGIDLSGSSSFRGALLDLDGKILDRVEVELADSRGDEAVAKVLGIADALVERSSRPLLGIGVGSPGVINLDGVVLTAPNLGWSDVHLRERLHERFGVPVVVGNDANAAALAEHTFGGASGDIMLVKVGYGVGAGLLLDGILQVGSRFSAGEIGHVVVGTDGGALCACGKHGCLETWLAVPRLDEALNAATDPVARDDVLRRAGARLGIALAPVVASLDLAEIVLSGPSKLLDGVLSNSTVETVRARTLREYQGNFAVRMTELGDDIVLRGAAVMVLSGQLGVS
jgi:predicted NBD/HSP70 family sugar kinase